MILDKCSQLPTKAVSVPLIILLTLLLLVLLPVPGAVSAGEDESGILTLTEAYQLALRQAPRLQSFRYQARARQELPKQARAQLLPKVYGSAASYYTNYEVSYLPDSVSETVHQYSITLQQPIFRPELWQRLSMAELQSESAMVQLRLEEQRLAREVAAAYFEVLISRKAVELAEERLEILRVRRDKVAVLLDRGLANKVDALDAVVEYERSRAGLVAAGSRLRVARLALRHLTGADNLEPPNLVLDRDGDFFSPAFLPPFEEWELGLEGNLEVLLARMGQVMAETDMRIRRFERYPSLDGRLSYSDSDSGEISSRGNDFRAMLELNIPLFQGGYAASRVREAQLAAASAREEVLMSLKEAGETLERAWAEHQVAVERLAVLADSRRLARLYFETARQAHAAGLQDELRVLEAKARLPEVELEMTEVVRQLVEAHLALKSVTGGLDQAAFTDLVGLLD